MNENKKKQKKRYELMPNLYLLIPELEFKVDSEERDKILQLQINKLSQKIKNIDKKIKEIENEFRNNNN